MASRDDAASDFEEELTAIARSVTDEDRVLQQPPPDIWDGIRQTILNERVIPFPTPPQTSPESPAPTEPAPAADPQPTDPKAFGRASDITPRHLVLAIAAAMTLMMASAAWLNERSSGPAPVTLASVAITNTDLPVAFDQQGGATLVAEGDQLYLDLALPSLPTLPDEGGYYELWLIDRDIDDMVSLGAVRESTRIALPDGVDPTTLPIVDVSVEFEDGDPTHSGQSLLRGVLEL